jgi:hypothetical protein
MQRRADCKRKKRGKFYHRGHERREEGAAGSEFLPRKGAKRREKRAAFTAKNAENAKTMTGVEIRDMLLASRRQRTQKTGGEATSGQKETAGAGFK